MHDQTSNAVRQAVNVYTPAPPRDPAESICRSCVLSYVILQSGYHSQTAASTDFFSFLFFFKYPFYSLRTFLYPSPSLDVIQVQGLFKQTLPPPPHYGTRLHFYPEKTPAIIYSGVFSSSTRSIESRLPSLASRSQQLIPSSFYCANNSKSQTHVGF